MGASDDQQPKDQDHLDTLRSRSQSQSGSQLRYSEIARNIFRSNETTHPHNYARRLSKVNNVGRLQALAPSSVRTPPVRTRRTCDKSTHHLRRPKGILVGKNRRAKCNTCGATVVDKDLPEAARSPCEGHSEPDSEEPSLSPTGSFDLDTIVQLTRQLVESQSKTDTTYEESHLPDTEIDASTDRDHLQFQSGFRAIPESTRPTEEKTARYHNFAGRLSEVNARAKTQPLAPSSGSCLVDSNAKVQPHTSTTTSSLGVGEKAKCDGSSHRLKNVRGVLIGKSLKAKCYRCTASAVNTDMPEVAREPCKGSTDTSLPQRSQKAHRLTERSGSIVCLKEGCELRFPSSEVLWRTPAEREFRREEARKGKRIHRKSSEIKSLNSLATSLPSLE
ncbi:hypothetical protein I302_104007 [Kwoniella bestiolae CBS 10118]|uniref:Uncharacterized protein n=1 Tax=Kwoniella bestiolae CBS 10118 TaxID=1296100 RepID=A0A1B9GA04_9TREE|nr:hypothetical protein I302_02712 [Kwoniella bestiolae CBS 10118]OCF27862.1 hypothetical protein I302_02712 [Kwoniella bestiolae CBS 10118]